MHLDFPPPKEHDVAHRYHVAFTVQARAAPRVVVSGRPRRLERIDAASHVGNELCGGPRRSLFDCRYSTGISPVILMADFTAFCTFEQVHVAVRVSCEVRQYVAPRPALQKRWCATLVVGDFADRLEKQLVRAGAAFDVSIEETGVDVHAPSTVVAPSCARLGSESPRWCHLARDGFVQKRRSTSTGSPASTLPLHFLAPRNDLGASAPTGPRTCPPR